MWCFYYWELRIDFAVAVPAMCPVAHAHWKLKPPMRPSTSRISPTTERLGQRSEDIVLRSIWSRGMPPAVVSA